MKQLTPYQKKFAKLIVGGVLYTLMMVIGTYLLSLFVEDNNDKVPYFFMAIMLLMVVIYIYRVIIAKHKEPLLFIRYGVLITLYIALAVFAICAKYNPNLFHVVAYGYILGLIIDRTFSLLHHHRPRNIVLAVIVYVYCVLMIFLFTTVLFYENALEGQGNLVYILIPLTLIITSFIDAVKLVFSGLRRQTLIGIIKKTYAIEILYGLLTLIVATSIMLMVFESGFENYGDALWYCFMVVTTIGFGDFTCTTIVGRMLTVVLGIYGIIVVALITSIIVNFYNESSKDKSDEKIVEMVKKLDEERKEVQIIEDQTEAKVEKVEEDKK